jgi:small glutamine-rich tetratricopeptide repeat-containing protein alpha
MTAKRHAEAIDSYTRAIARDPTSAVYHSNRAAAHISLGDHASAANDAERAIELDPKFVRAYSRLGYVCFFPDHPHGLELTMTAQTRPVLTR